MVKLLMLLMLLYSMPLCPAGSDGLNEWTWVYRKNFIERDRKAHEKKKFLLFEQGNVAPFTQLIFSWNAFRPLQGHFSFLVQVRDAATKKWGVWHRMVEWGHNMQQSFLSKSDGFSSHIHVRLETDDKKPADGFKIKVEPHNCASLGLVQGVSVAFSNFNLFKPQPHHAIDQELASVHLADMPTISQFALEHDDKGRICSPVSCSMVAHYLTGKYNDPLDFAVAAFDTGLGVYGSWPCNMAHAFEECDGKVNFFVRRMNSFKDVHQQLMQGMPVVVSVRGTLPGAFKPFPQGHLMVIVGWDSNTREVLCHDPACESDEMVFKRYPLEEFLRAWECSHRLAYVAEPVSPVRDKH